MLVDYDLCDGKGDVLVREIRSAGDQVPIIGVSSRDDGNDWLLQAGASVICNKMQFNRIQNVIDSVVSAS